jgi:glycosyltransferase involved in cell wall biosynthesis
LKILFIIERLFAGGRQRRLVELIKCLAVDPKYNISVVTMRREIHYKEIFDIPNVKIHFIIRKFKKDPIPFFGFYNLCKKIKPDIIHTWSNMVTIYILPAILLLKITLIDGEVTDAPEKVRRGLISSKITFPFADIILSNSKAGLLAYNAPLKKCKVIHNGFNFNRLNNLRDKDSLKKSIGITNSYVVGMVASFSKYKDYNTFIQSAKIILQNRNDFKVTFLCIGQGDYHLYQKLVPQKFEKNILFIKKQTDIESYMNICDIGVLATNTDIHGEGIPNTILEFMALEKPVIATNCGGTPELLSDNDVGFLVKPKSPQDLAKKIQILMKDSQMAISMGLKGKDRVINYFSIDKMIAEFENIYSVYN